MKKAGLTCLTIIRFSLSVMMVLNFGLTLFEPAVVAAEDSRFFPETQHSVNGKFLDYWRKNGGLATFGYPITEAQPEVDPETDKTFLTQWFERNRFELHPENAGTKYEVLLGLLGKDLRREALAVDPDFQRAERIVNPSQPADLQAFFEETGHNLRFQFLDYWRKNGGLERFGFPISEVHKELEPETGKFYEIQWFERARFEFHPESQPPYDVLLGLLGKQIKTPRSGNIEFVWKTGRDYRNLYGPSGVAVDKQGYVYVADTGNHRIQKYDSNGHFIFRWGQPGYNDGEIYYPQTIAVDKQGNVYVAGNQGCKIQKFDSTGRFLLMIGNCNTSGGDPKLDRDGEFSYVGGIALDEQGNLYLSDSNNNRVQKFDSNGHFLTKWGSEGEDDGEFKRPAGIVLDKQGNIFVSDVLKGQIQKFDGNGRFITKWNDTHESLTVDNFGNIYTSNSSDGVAKYDNNGNLLLYWGSRGSSDGQFSRSGPIAFYSRPGIAMDEQGNVYVSDIGNNRIQKFDDKGQFLTKWGGSSVPEDQFSSSWEIAIDGPGNIYAINNDLFRIQKFDNTGRFLTKWGSQGMGDGQFSAPTSIAADKQGNIYVADSGNDRIQKFDSQGRFLTKWGSPGTNNGQFGFIFGVTVDSLGNVFTIDACTKSRPGFDCPYQKSNNIRIQKFDSNGHFLLKWNILEDLDTNEVTGGIYAITMAVDSQGNIYIALAEASNVTRGVQKFDNSGHLLFKLDLEPGGLEFWFFYPRGIAVDEQGNFYVGDMLRLLKFDHYGRFLVKWGDGQGPGDNNFKGLVPIGSEISGGTADGQFSTPRGVAVDAQGNVFVTDDSGRLQKFRQR